MEDKELRKQLVDAKRRLSEAQDEYDTILKKCGENQKEYLKIMKEKYDGRFFRCQSPNEKFPPYFYIEEITGIDLTCGDDWMRYITKSMMLRFSVKFGVYEIILKNAHRFEMRELSQFVEISKQEFLDVFDGLLNSASDIRKKME